MGKFLLCVFRGYERHRLEDKTRKSFYKQLFKILSVWRQEHGDITTGRMLPPPAVGGRALGEFLSWPADSSRMMEVGAADLHLKLVPELETCPVLFSLASHCTFCELFHRLLPFQREPVKSVPREMLEICIVLFLV